MSAIERLGRNFRFSALSRAVGIAGSLVLTPFILARVDLGLFGLNALIVSVLGYFSLLDLGLNAGISRYIAALYGKRDWESISQVLRFGVVFFTVMGMCVAAAGAVLSLGYERVITIDKSLVAQGRALIGIHSLAALFLWCVIPFRGVLNGLQRLDIIHKVGAVIGVATLPLAWAVLTWSGDYIVYVGLLQAMTVALSAVNVVAAIRLIPGFTFNQPRLSGVLKKNLLHFSGWSFLAGIFGIVIFQVDNLVIAGILGVDAVAVYTVAFSIHNYVRSLNALVGSPVYYAITAAYSKRDEAAANEIILRAARLHAGILVPAVIISFICIDKFILAWVGSRFAGAVLPCRVLIGYWAFSVTTEILSQGVVGGKGLVVEAVKINGFVAATNLGLSLYLIRYLGITGVALGTALPWIAASIFYVFRFCGLLAIPTSRFFRRAVWSNLPHYALAVGMSLMVSQFLDEATVFTVAAMMAGVYLVTIAFGYCRLDEESRQLIRRLLATGTEMI